jgi:dipeptidyl aminopeptidase/acylaminoacyl peptidase
MQMNYRYIGWSVRVLMLAFLLLQLTNQTEASATMPFSDSLGKRHVTVEDAIRMTRLAAPDYMLNGGRAGYFSPDGKRFAVVLISGNLQDNTNQFSLLLYSTADLLSSPKPDTLLRMSSSSNRDAITKLRWSADNETLIFLGENPNEPAQIYAFNIRTRQLKKLTNHPTAIVGYDIDIDRDIILFTAEPPSQKTTDTEQSRRNGIAITNQSLAHVLAGDCSPPTWPISEQLFLMEGGSLPVSIPIRDSLLYKGPISLSPDGRYALIGVHVQSVPAHWVQYQDQRLRKLIRAGRRDDEFSMYFSEYLVLDVNRKFVEPLLNDVPMLYFHPVIWSADGRSVFLRTKLPLDGMDLAERESREKSEFDIEILLPGKEYHKVSDEKWPKGREPIVPLDVTLEEDSNTPPKLYVTDPHSKQKSLLLDLNPQFGALQFGTIRIINWSAPGGHEIEGGLYFPPDYIPGKRYPLIIQTHGFSSNRFWIDGPFTSAYAAQPLAAAGFLVLQMGRSRKEVSDIDNTTEEGVQGMTEIEGAIDYLDYTGLIDRNKVGLIGFSRTVYHVSYTLTHSKYTFAAAILADGIDAGYFQYLAIGGEDYVLLNGGPPFGQTSAMWLQNSPGFNLDKVHTPVQLLAFGAESAGVLVGWEWYAGLKIQRKPVDFVYLPDAPHVLVKPWNRKIAQQGVVDWFNFWIKGREDPISQNQEQYVRWRNLRDGWTAKSSVN